MSETTKRAMLLSPFDNPSWRSATDAERAEWFRLHSNSAPRPSTFGAEGGAERETTNSPAEIGGGCTGRKMARLAGQCAALVLSFAPICFIALWIDRKEGLLCTVISVTISAAVSWYLWPPVVVRRRGSGGEGV